MNAPLGLYIHIPFCRQRCGFCSFYLEVYRKAAATNFLTALRTEMEIYAKQEGIVGRPLQSVYFGGGTPTALDAPRLTGIVADVHSLFELSDSCEVTVEAHPATVSKHDLDQLADAGVTRMSFGAESMRDSELASVGRPGLTSDTVTAVLHARDAGFTDINLDVMYGLPGQDLASWRHTVARCLELAPTHLSCYALTVEEGTGLAHHIERRRRPAPDEGLQVAMDEAAEAILNASGYERYEISNYAKPGYACRHNLLHWTEGDYLGVGPSAQSFLNGVRFGNVANLTAYQAALAEQRCPVEDRVTLTEQERLRDGVIFGLRLIRGISTHHLHHHVMNYGCATTVEDLRKQQLIEEDGTRVRLTAKGRRYADHVWQRLY